MENRVGCGPIPSRACSSPELFNGQAHCRHLGCSEIDPLAVKSLGVSFSPIKLPSNLRAPEPIWGVHNEAFNLFAPLRVLLVEHWLKQLCKRHVQTIEPICRLVAIVAVGVPAPTGREHNVAGLHWSFLAIHHRKRTFTVDNDS